MVEAILVILFLVSLGLLYYIFKLRSENYWLKLRAGGAEKAYDNMYNMYKAQQRELDAYHETDPNWVPLASSSSGTFSMFPYTTSVQGTATGTWQDIFQPED